MINDTEFGVPGRPSLWSNRNNIKKINTFNDYEAPTERNSSQSTKRKKINTFNDEAAPATSNSPQSINHTTSTNHQMTLTSNYNFNLITPINKDQKKNCSETWKYYTKIGTEDKKKYVWRCTYCNSDELQFPSNRADQAKKHLLSCPTNPFVPHNEIDIAGFTIIKSELLHHQTINSYYFIRNYLSKYEFSNQGFGWDIDTDVPPWLPINDEFENESVFCSDNSCTPTTPQQQKRWKKIVDNEDQTPNGKLLQEQVSYMFILICFDCFLF